MKLEKSLRKKPYWTTQEARRLVKDEWGIELSESQIRRILRDKLQMEFSKGKGYKGRGDSHRILG